MNAIQSTGRKLDSILRILTVAFALTLVSVTTPLVLADQMGNHERGPAEATECGTVKTESLETTISQDKTVCAGTECGAPAAEPLVRAADYGNSAYMTPCNDNTCKTVGEPTVRAADYGDAVYQPRCGGQP